MFSKKPVLFVVGMLILASILMVACSAPEAEIVEKVVTQIIKETVVVEGTPVVVEREVTKVVTVVVEKEVEVEVEVEKEVVVEATPVPKVFVIGVGFDKRIGTS